MEPRIIQKSNHYFTEVEKHKIINAFLSGHCTKMEIWKKYTGKEDHGRLLQWMRQLGYDTKMGAIKPTIASNYYSMQHKKAKLDKPIYTADESFENLQLKKRIAELEKQLKDAELKAIAFSTMVDIAEKEFKIPIRKKFNTKP